MAERSPLFIGDGTVTVGRVQTTGGWRDDGTVQVADALVRPLSLGERNRLVSSAGPGISPDMLARLVYHLAISEAGSGGSVGASAQAVALYLAGADGKGSLEETTLLASRGLGPAIDFALIDALDADRVAASLADALLLSRVPTSGSALDTGGASDEPGWTTIRFDHPPVAVPGAQYSAEQVRDTLARQLAERAVASLDPSTAAALLGFETGERADGGLRESAGQEAPRGGSPTGPNRWIAPPPGQPAIRDRFSGSWRRSRNNNGDDNDVTDITTPRPRESADASVHGHCDWQTTRALIEGASGTPVATDELTREASQQSQDQWRRSATERAAPHRGSRPSRTERDRQPQAPQPMARPRPIGPTAGRTGPTGRHTTDQMTMRPQASTSRQSALSHSVLETATTVRALRPIGATTSAPDSLLSRSSSAHETTRSTVDHDDVSAVVATRLQREADLRGVPR